MEDPALEGGRHRLRPVVHAELRQDAAHEPLRGAAGEVRLPWDLDVGAALGHALQHFDLAGGQARSRPPVRDAARQLGRNLAKAGVHGTDRGHELRGRRALEEVGPGPGLQGSVDVLVALVDGEGDEAAAWELRADGFHDPDPVQDGQAQIDEGNVGTELLEQLHRLTSVSGLAHDGHVALAATTATTPCRTSGWSSAIRTRIGT